jgi:hypothetical protein
MAQRYLKELCSNAKTHKISIYYIDVAMCIFEKNIPL